MERNSDITRDLEGRDSPFQIPDINKSGELEIINVFFIKLNVSEILRQRHSQDPRKHLRWRALQQ